LDINGLGQVVGSAACATGDAQEHAVLWTGGVIKDLGTLGGPYSRAWAINNSGQVVGESQDSSGGQPAFLWSDGVMMDLGTPPGAEWVVAYDINNSGQVVGQFYGPLDDISFVEHGFVWSAGSMTDLGILGSATGIPLVNINDWGQVVMCTGGSVSLFSPLEKNLEFTGFLSPIEGADTTGGSIVDPIRAFKLRSTIPVKMILNREASPVTTGNHILQLFKVNDKTTLDIAVDATPADAATTGNSFRLSDASTGEWHFNLSTKGLSRGIWQIKATLSDNTSHTAFIELK
ncbi:hypothetical protein EG830_15745, partial [bacterium]|nr:hypothetical protein [bacterium]